jgi:hypothetical protein
MVRRPLLTAAHLRQAARTTNRLSINFNFRDGWQVVAVQLSLWEIVAKLETVFGWHRISSLYPMILTERS